MGLRPASLLNRDSIDNHIPMFVILLQGDISYDPFPHNIMQLQLLCKLTKPNHILL